MNVIRAITNYSQKNDTFPKLLLTRYNRYLQVLQRIEDVSLMCEKRVVALKQQLIKPMRPIQTVTPEPVKSMQPPLIQTVKGARILKKANTMPRVNMLSIDNMIALSDKVDS